MGRGIDPYSLRLFLAAAREGSIARAASTEHIAASALSRRIADLEHAFGVPLFVRSSHGIALTEAGKVVLARGGKLIASNGSEWCHKTPGHGREAVAHKGARMSEQLGIARGACEGM